MTEPVSSVFWKLVSMSLAASVFILLAALLRVVMKRLPKRLPCLLWAVCLVRLLVPFSLRSSFSLLPRSVSSLADSVAGGASDAAIAAEQTLETIRDLSGAASLPDGIGETGTAEALSPGLSGPSAAAFFETVLRILPYIWLAGVLAFAVYALVSAVRLRSVLKSRVPFDVGPACGAPGLPDRTRIFVVPGLGSAFCTGFFRPGICLPAGLSENALRCVLAHEAAHLRRRDPLLKGAAFLALALHWANPLVWLLFRLLGADMEMAADEAVLARDRSFAKTDYSQTILNCAAGRSGLPLGVLAFGSGSVRRRIRNVLSFRKFPRPLLTAVTTLVLILGTSMLWDPPAVAPPDVTEEPDGTGQSIGLTIPEQEPLPASSGTNVSADTDENNPLGIYYTMPDGNRVPAAYQVLPNGERIPLSRDQTFQLYMQSILHIGEANAMPPEEDAPDDPPTPPAGPPAPAGTVAEPAVTSLPEPAPSDAAPQSGTHTVFVVNLNSLKSAASEADPQP